jgi:hypothetical protein
MLSAQSGKPRGSGDGGPAGDYSPPVSARKPEESRRSLGPGMGRPSPEDERKQPRHSCLGKKGTRPRKSRPGRKNPVDVPSFFRPCGARCALWASIPTVETVGYDRPSLRDFLEPRPRTQTHRLQDIVLGLPVAQEVDSRLRGNDKNPQPRAAGLHLFFTGVALVLLGQRFSK